LGHEIWKMQKYLDSILTDGGEVIGLTHRPTSTP
jgi:hypothetical protein